MGDNTQSLLDDVLIFGLLMDSVWVAIHNIFTKFCKALGMEENEDKSCIYYADGDRVIYDFIGSLFKFRKSPLIGGFTYLGFHMKPS